MNNAFPLVCVGVLPLAASLCVGLDAHALRRVRPPPEATLHLWLQMWLQMWIQEWLQMWLQRLPFTCTSLSSPVESAASRSATSAPPWVASSTQRDSSMWPPRSETSAALVFENSQPVARRRAHGEAKRKVSLPY